MSNQQDPEHLNEEMVYNLRQWHTRHNLAVKRRNATIALTMWLFALGFISFLGALSVGLWTGWHAEANAFSLAMFIFCIVCALVSGTSLIIIGTRRWG